MTALGFRNSSAWMGHAGEPVVTVPVSFDLEWKWRWFGSDVSLEEGETLWGYLLVKDRPSEPWRIFDQGTG